jgi:predicted amidohydrolase
VTRRPLCIAVAHPLTVPCDVAVNAATHAAAVREAAARVVVVPELSLTGYEFGAPAVEALDPRLAPIVEACRATGALALVGAPVAAEVGGRAIGVLAVDGTGARVAYRKVHLGGDEPSCFVAGEARVVLEVEGWRLGLAVCRDTGIPDHAAQTAALGLDVYVAGVLEHAVDAAVPEERARRIAGAHGVWVAIASFAGSTGEGYATAAGCSGIWAPDGGTLARAGASPGEMVRATLA